MSLLRPGVIKQHKATNSYSCIDATSLLTPKLEMNSLPGLVNSISTSPTLMYLSMGAPLSYNPLVNAVQTDDKKNGFKQNGRPDTYSNSGKFKYKCNHMWSQLKRESCIILY